MASWNNFSKKDRNIKDSNTFENPQNLETNKINQNKLKSFQDSKEKWRELCSYFRLNK